MPRDREPSYVLVLHPLPHDVPVAIRLRRGLKYLLRECSLRCTAIRVETVGDAKPEVAPRGMGGEKLGPTIGEPQA